MKEKFFISLLFMFIFAASAFSMGQTPIPGVIMEVALLLLPAEAEFPNQRPCF